MTGTDCSRVGEVIARLSVIMARTLSAASMAAVMSHPNRCHSIPPPSPRQSPRSAGGESTAAAAADAADCSTADFQIGYVQQIMNKKVIFVITVNPIVQFCWEQISLQCH